MTEYDLGKVVGDDGEAGNGIASITKTGTSGLVDTYTITYDDGTTSTFTVTNGSDASVTIQTAWGSTTSDSKVPSEKLTKDSLDNKVSKSSTTGLLKNDGTVMTSGTGSSNYSAGNHTHSGYISTSSTTGLVKNDGSIMTSGTGSSNWAVGNHSHSGYVSATKVTSWSGTVSDSNVPSEKLVKNTIDGLSIPTKTSDLTNDGADGTNVYVANNDSRLSDSRTPTSHTHGNLTNDGKVGSNANYIVVTGTGGAITSVQKLGNITYDGKIGSTSGKPVITTTSGTVTTGSFGSTAGTFAEGNHTHSGYISTSSTTGLVKNDGSIMTSGTGSTNYAAGNHTHSGYVSATKVTSWQSTPSDSNVPSEKLVKDYVDGLIGSAISYIVGSGS